VLQDLTGEEADLSLSESQQIREAINAYAGYTIDRAEADEANREVGSVPVCLWIIAYIWMFRWR
jgi:hypothetical protein